MIMADVINLSDHRKEPSKKPTVDELIEFCAGEISTNWERFARNNKLNDYFIESVPWATSGLDYLTDLNALSRLEHKINLPLEVSSPGMTSEDQLGWLASFKIFDIQDGNQPTYNILVTTPFMASEAYARAYLILLFLKLRREFAQHEII